MCIRDSYGPYYRSKLGFPQVVWQSEVRSYRSPDTKPKLGDPALYMELARSIGARAVQPPRVAPATMTYMAMVPNRAAVS